MLKQNKYSVLFCSDIDETLHSCSIQPVTWCAWGKIILVQKISREIMICAVQGYPLWFDGQFKWMLFVQA